MRNHVARNPFDCGIDTTVLLSHGLRLDINENAVLAPPHPEYEKITFTEGQVKEIPNLSYQEASYLVDNIIQQRLSLKYGSDSINVKDYFLVPYFDLGCFLTYLTMTDFCESDHSRISGVLVLPHNKLTEKFNIESAKDITKDMIEKIHTEARKQINYISAKNNDDHVELVVTAEGDLDCYYQAKALETVNPECNKALNETVLGLVDKVLEKIDSQGSKLTLKINKGLVDKNADLDKLTAKIRRHIINEIETTFGFNFPMSHGELDLNTYELSIGIITHAIPSDDLLISIMADDAFGNITDKRDGRVGWNDKLASNLEVMFDYVYGVDFASCKIS